MATNEDNPVLAGPAPNLDVEGFVRFSGYASMLALVVHIFIGGSELERPLQNACWTNTAWASVGLIMAMSKSSSLDLYGATTIAYFLVPCWVMTIVGWIRFRLTTKKNKSRSVQIALYIQHLATSAFVLVVCYGTPEFGTDPSQNGDRVVRIFVKVKTVSMPLRYACVVFSWVLLTVSRLFDAGIGRGIVLSMERRVPRWLFALALLSFFGAWVGNSEASLRDNHPQTGENAVSSVGQLIALLSGVAVFWNSLGAGYRAYLLSYRRPKIQSKVTPADTSELALPHEAQEECAVLSALEHADENYIGKLNEHYQKQRLLLPKYTTSFDPRSRQWKAAVTVMHGERVAYYGQGRSKALAKHAAAKASLADLV